MIGIRVDGNSIIATGHIMRCLSIATAIRDVGLSCTFIVADEQSKYLLENYDFPVVVLNTDWKSLDLELPKIISILPKIGIDKLVVDSYYVTKKYLETLENYCPVLYIDDFFKIHPQISAVLNYAVFAPTLPYTKYYGNSDIKLLLGLAYAPLRQEFKMLKSVFHETVSKILVTAGGADTYNVIGMITRAVVNDLFFSNIELHLVVGVLNKNLDDLIDISKKYGNVIIHYNVTDMALLMQNSDIAITAGGTTMCELCACGIPSVCFSVADNQLNGVKGFESHGLMLYAGDFRENQGFCINNILKSVKMYIVNPEIRISFSKRMQNAVDGNGALRIAEEIINL